MLISLLILAKLYTFADGTAVDLNVCFMFIPGPAGDPVRRPTVPVENCQDRDPTACFEIFKPDDNNLGQVLADNRMP